MVYMDREDIAEKLIKMTGTEVMVGTEHGYVGVTNVLELNGRVVILLDTPVQQVMRGAYND